MVEPKVAKARKPELLVREEEQKAMIIPVAVAVAVTTAAAVPVDCLVAVGPPIWEGSQMDLPVPGLT